MNEPGNRLIRDLSNEDYHRHPSLSKSQLAEFLISPARYYGLYLDPARPLVAETTGQRAGSLLHTLVLEPETFSQRYAVGPDCNRNTKAWKAFEETLPEGITPLKAEELDTAHRQATSLRAHQEIAELLGSGTAEASMFWQDTETGVDCRVRPDWLHESGENGLIVLDIKTGPANPRLFALQVARMTYDLQDAMYTTGIEAVTGKTVLAFVFGVVGSAPPYLSSCCMLDDLSRDSGMRKFRRGLKDFAECQRTNHWPGYQDVQLITVPAWALELDEE